MVLYPVITGSINVSEPYVIRINGLTGLLGREDDNLSDLATRGKVGEKQLIKYNDLTHPISIDPGQVYYLESKRGKAKLYFHTASPHESLWSISQKFGIKLKRLRKLNRIGKSEEVQPGRVLWLRKTRPKDKRIEYRRDLVTPSTERTFQAEVEGDVIAPADVTNSRTHIVVQGETLYSVSRLYGCSVADLIALNTLEADDAISIGQTLVIPELPQGDTEQLSRVLFHDVIQGDNLFQIAGKYEISVEDIMGWNNKRDHNIQVGEKLLVVSPQ